MMRQGKGADSGWSKHSTADRTHAPVDGPALPGMESIVFTNT